MLLDGLSNRSGGRLPDKRFESRARLWRLERTAVIPVGSVPKNELPWNSSEVREQPSAGVLMMPPRSWPVSYRTCIVSLRRLRLF